VENAADHEMADFRVQISDLISDLISD